MSCSCFHSRVLSEIMSRFSIFPFIPPGLETWNFANSSSNLSYNEVAKKIAVQYMHFVVGIFVTFRDMEINNLLFQIQ